MSAVSAIGARPSMDGIAAVVRDLRAALFPEELGALRPLDAVLDDLREQVRRCLALAGEAGDAERLVAGFVGRIPAIRSLAEGDIGAALAGDPAARSRAEILLAYPGVRALFDHRVAHELHLLGVPLLPRIAAEAAHSATGIDIHPGATIGERLFIDHGTGVVIGETAIIGAGVRIYQGVTLGAKSFPRGDDGSLVKGLPRHPIIGDDVVIYSGATILGRVTVGSGSTIGGNVWLTRSVPPGSRVTQAQSRDEEFGGDGTGI